MRIGDLIKSTDNLLSMTDLTYVLVKRENKLNQNYQYLQVDLEEISITKLADQFHDYITNEKDLNLSLIEFYKKRYDCKVGYSGHEKTVSPSIIAATLGANTIERHITLDRSMIGTAHAASLEETGLLNLVRVIRKLPIITGKPEKIL